MAGVGFLPVKLRFSRKCDRCGYRYSRKEDQCTHCAHLNEQQLSELKEQRREEYAGNSSLGRIFLVAALLIAAILLLSRLGT